MNIAYIEKCRYEIQEKEVLVWYHVPAYFEHCFYHILHNTKYLHFQASSDVSLTHGNVRLQNKGSCFRIFNGAHKDDSKPKRVVFCNK